MRKNMSATGFITRVLKVMLVPGLTHVHDSDHYVPPSCFVDLVDLLELDLAVSELAFVSRPVRHGVKTYKMRSELGGIKPGNDL
jgi:hypothetical protein